MLPPPITTATSTPEPRHLGDLGDDAIDHLAIDAVRILAHQRFARQLEQDAPVARARAAGTAATGTVTAAGLAVMAANSVRVGAEASAAADYALVIAATSAAKSSFFFSMPSPTTKRTKSLHDGALRLHELAPPSACRRP